MLKHGGMVHAMLQIAAVAHRLPPVDLPLTNEFVTASQLPLQGHVNQLYVAHLLWLQFSGSLDVPFCGNLVTLNGAVSTDLADLNHGANSF